jgi:hypothetical protein
MKYRKINMKKFTYEVESKIKDYIARGYTASEIEKALVNDKSFYGHDIPTQRTIANWMKKYAFQDDEVWTLADCDDPEDAQIVLKHLRNATEGAILLDLPIPRFSKRLANMLVRVHRAVPDVPLEIAWSAALAFLYADSGTIQAWELYLAYRIWEQPDLETHHLFFSSISKIKGKPSGQFSLFINIPPLGIPTDSQSVIE